VLSDGSVAASAAGEVAHVTKSHHHQGVEVLGEGLTVTGVSPLDDLPEAIELPGRRFVLGVQWHPEADPASTVVDAFVDAARAAAVAGGEPAGDLLGLDGGAPQGARSPSADSRESV
jgi:putative glutamine amidotransferase